MPRLSLLLAACDSSSPEDALVGTWTLTSLSTDTQVTSRTTQTIVNRSAPPSGAIAVTGATTASLGMVANLSADDDGNVNLAVESTVPGVPGHVQLVLSEFASESQANLIDADAGLGYVAYFTPRRSLVSRNGGRFTVASVTMSTGTVTASASGTLTYPEVALTPGTPTRAERVDVPLDGTTIRFTFEEDGTFRATTLSPADDQDATGTWELVGGDLRISVTEGSVTETITFRYTLQGNTLEIEAADVGEFSCTGECLRSYEGLLFATPGSLSAVELLFTYRFRAGSSAAGQVVPEARRSAPRGPRPAPPIIGRFL